jgi:hypothetical protein
MNKKQTFEKISPLLINKIINFQKDHISPMNFNLTEEYLYFSLKEIGENPIDWIPNSHKKSEDMKSDTFGRISAKSGKINKFTNTLSFSSSRTGKYNTLKDKIDFFHIDTEDSFISLSTNETKLSTKYLKPYLNKEEILDYLNTNKTYIEYHLSFFDTDIIKHSNSKDITKWKEVYGVKNKKINGWIYNDEKITIEIKNSLSSQIWITIKNFNSSNFTINSFNCEKLVI